MKVRAGVIPRLAAWLTVLAAGACTRDPAASFPELPLGEPVRVGDAVSASPGAEPELFHATALASTSSGVLIMDAGNRRLSLLDDSLAAVAHWGAAGAGPDEFGFVLAMAARADTVALGDLTNGRILLFDVRAGRGTGAVAAGGAETFAWLRDGSFVVPTGVRGTFLTRMTGSGGREPFGVWPAALPIADAQRLLVSGCPDTVLALDQGHGVLMRFSAAGTLISAHRLPAAVLRHLQRHRARMEKTLRVAGIRGRPALVKQLVAATCDELFLLFAHPDMFGLLISYRDSTARPMLLPRDSAGSRPLRRAAALLPLPGSLVVLTEDEVRRYAYR